MNKNKFNNKNKFLIGFLGLLLSLIVSPFSVKAAGIYFDVPTEKIYQGDTFSLNLKISSSDKLINAVEGHLIFDKEKLEVKEISTGGSLFTIWAKLPKFSNEKGIIDFIGGVPEGFQKDEATILKIFFLAKKTGQAKLDLKDNTLFFLHDGKGTPINPWLRSLSLNILERPAEISPKDEWQEIIKKDKTPPEPFEIILSRDPSIYNNQWFITFFTSDKESGIDYYQVKEGEKEWKRAESPYLLKDQSLKSLIKVKAVDKAGNERIGELIPVASAVPFYKNILFWIIIVILLIVFVYVFWRYFRKKNKI